MTESDKKKLIKTINKTSIGVIIVCLSIIAIIPSKDKQIVKNSANESIITNDSSNNLRKDTVNEKFSVGSIFPIKQNFYMEEVTSYYYNPRARKNIEYSDDIDTDDFDTNTSDSDDFDANNDGPDVRTYMFGIYIKLPKDTTGVADEIIDYVRQKSRIVINDEAAHFYFFSDINIIPKSFQGNWTTRNRKRKCFAYGAKIVGGQLIYNYNPMGQFGL